MRNCTHGHGAAVKITVNDWSCCLRTWFCLHLIPAPAPLLPPFQNGRTLKASWRDVPLEGPGCWPRCGHPAQTAPTLTILDTHLWPTHCRHLSCSLQVGGAEDFRPRGEQAWPLVERSRCGESWLPGPWPACSGVLSPNISSPGICRAYPEHHSLFWFSFPSFPA